MFLFQKTRLKLDNKYTKSNRILKYAKSMIFWGN